MLVLKALVVAALSVPALALCPYAERALQDPSILKEVLEKREENAGNEKRQVSAILPTFSKDQRVDVTGTHAWRAPGRNDIRGPCPGLNALANHGYLPHNGVTPLAQAATATEQVFGMGAEMGVLLSVYATVIDGNIVEGSWSIGGRPPQTLLSPLQGPGDGLSGSHNKYEGDASPTRGDYYLYNGDVASLRVDQFKALYDLAKNDPVPNYNLDVLIKYRKYSFQKSVNTNPYFFYGPITGPVVSTAAHTFIPAFMSNHSATYPNGILDKETLKSFFAINESPAGQLTWTPGYERIPDNWYRRPLGVANEYNVASLAQDLVKMAAVVPETVSVGGNTGTTNSFAGVDLGDITGGVYHTSDLLVPSKFVCFVYQITLAVVPDILRSSLTGTILQTALNLLNNKISPFVDPACATIGNYNDAFTAQFPGSARP